MNEQIREMIVFVLEDDNEIMAAALGPDCDLDEENKRLNRELIEQHKAIIAKVENGQQLTGDELQLVRDANEIHLNDIDNLNGRHREAVELDHWLDLMTELSAKEAFEILERHLDKEACTPTIVLRALHALWEEITPDDGIPKKAFDENGRCVKCRSKVSFADVTDTIVFAGHEVVKRYDGDITNRNCIGCNYPKQYPDFKEYDK